MSIGAIKDRIYNMFQASPLRGAPFTSAGVVIENDTPFSVIDYIDRYIEEGKQFESGHVFNSVTNGGSVFLLVKTVSKIHTSFHVVGRGNGLVRLYEDAVLSNDGTPTEVINYNRTSSNTIDTTIYHTPTITNNGDQLNGDSLLIGGTGQSSVGGNEDLFGRGLILKPNTNYLIEVINNSGNNASFEISVRMYAPEV